MRSQLVDGFLGGRVVRVVRGRFSVVVHDGGVVAAAEGAADLFVAGAGELAGQVNDDGAGERRSIACASRF